jgi:hypothetical protein
MTILILFQQSHSRTFKASYTEYVHRHLRSEFPTLVSYGRFASVDAHGAGAPGAPICTPNWVSVAASASSTPLPLPSATTPVFTRNRVFDGRAARGKTSVGWFYGFKLHLVVNDQGQILAFCLTPGNVDDRHPVPKLATGFVGKLKGSKGSLSQPLAHQLLVTHGLQLITKLRKKMHNRLLDWSDKLRLAHTSHQRDYHRSAQKQLSD